MNIDLAALFCLMCIIVGIYVIKVYIRLLKLHNTISDSYMILDMYFRRRWDITTSYIDLVEAHVKDRDEMECIKELHIGVYEGLSRQRKFSTNSAYTKALGDLVIICNDIDKVTNGEKELLEIKAIEIKKVEENISSARNSYNAAVFNYEAYLDKFPNSFLANKLHLGRYEVCN